MASVTGLPPPMGPIDGKRRPKRKAELRHEAKKKLEYKIARNLAPEYSLYVLRHSWATRALERGVDPLGGETERIRDSVG